MIFFLTCPKEEISDSWTISCAISILISALFSPHLRITLQCQSHVVDLENTITVHGQLLLPRHSPTFSLSFSLRSRTGNEGSLRNDSVTQTSLSCHPPCLHFLCSGIQRLRARYMVRRRHRQDTPSDFKHEQPGVELCQPVALNHILLKSLNKHYLDKFCHFYGHKYNQHRKCYHGRGQLPLFGHDRQYRKLLHMFLVIDVLRDYKPSFLHLEPGTGTRLLKYHAKYTILRFWV